MMKMTATPSARRPSSEANSSSTSCGTARRRLVEDEHPGTAVEHLEDLDPLALADAEGLDDGVGAHAQAVPVGQLVDAAPGGPGVERPEPGGLGAQHDVLEDGEVVGSMKCWWTMPIPAAMASPGLRNRTAHAVDGDLALVGPLHAVERLHQGRLAGAVLADQSVHLPAAHAERHVAVGDDAGEALGDPGEPHDGGGGVGRRCGARGLGAQRPSWQRRAGTTPRRPPARDADVRVGSPYAEASAGRTGYGSVGTVISPATICALSSSSCGATSSTKPPEVE
jgi:hypothetical protein